MKFSLKMRYLMSIVLIATKLAKIYLKDNSKTLLYFCDLDLSFKIKSQGHSLVNGISLKPVDGFSPNLQTYHCDKLKGCLDFGDLDLIFKVKSYVYNCHMLIICYIIGGIFFELVVEFSSNLHTYIIVACL